MKSMVQRAISRPTDVDVEVSYDQLCDVIDQVKNLILKWVRKLEKGGLVGRNMQFYIMQNVGT
jgi:hypothetical protein